MEEQKRAITEYLTMLARLQPLDDYTRLLTEGQWWTGRALPRAYPLGPLKACFSNAGRLAMDREGLTYCEGFAITDFFPVHHGWALDEHGQILEVTWRTRKRGRFYHPPDKTVYLGLTFTQDEFLAKLVRTKSWGMLLENDRERIHAEIARRRTAST